MPLTHERTQPSIMTSLSDWARDIGSVVDQMADLHDSGVATQSNFQQLQDRWSGLRQGLRGYSDEVEALLPRNKNSSGVTLNLLIFMQGTSQS